MRLNAFLSPSLNDRDISDVLVLLANNLITKAIYEPNKISSLADFTFELKMILKTLLDEIRSGNCEEEIERYFFLKELKDKNPGQYKKVLKWNHLEGVA